MFWKQWGSPYKQLYVGLVVLSVTSLVFFITAYLYGFNTSIGWDLNTQPDTVRLPIDTFRKGLFDFSIESDVFTALQQFSGSAPALNYPIVYLYFFLLTTALLFAFTVLSFLTGWYYYVGLALFSFYLVNLRVELLEPFGIGAVAFSVVPVLFFCGLNYFFNSIQTGIKLLYRFIAILALYVLYIGFLALSGKPVNLPYHIVNIGLIVPVCISLVFIAMVSFEIIYGFLYLVTNNKGTGGRNQSRHFIVVFLLYFANLVLIYLKNTRVLELDLVYISPFIILVASAVVGIEGFRERSFLFEKNLPFHPFGAYIYLCLGIVAFSTLGYVFATGNDSMGEMFEDAVLYMHIGFGLSFFVFIMTRYKGWIEANVRVNKIIYRVQGYPFMALNGMGILIVAVLFLKARMFPYYQAIAGYLNGVGDTYLEQKDVFFAEEYYKHALGYEFHNHKSNYALGSLYNTQHKAEEASVSFRQAIMRAPSEYAYINLGNAYFEVHRPLDALEALRQGLAVFPGSYRIYNNLALIFNRLSIPDSASIYIQKSIQSGGKEVAVSNQLAFLVKHRIVVDINNLLKDTRNDYLPLSVNRMAYKCLTREHTREPFNHSLFKDSTLTTLTFSYLNNYWLTNLGSKDTTGAYLAELLGARDTNQVYAENLHYLAANLHFYGENKPRAILIMDRLQQSQIKDPAFYLNTLGLWMFKKEQYAMAAHLFAIAAERGNVAAVINHKISLTEVGPATKSLPLWTDSLSATDSSLQQTVLTMRAILSDEQITSFFTTPEPVRYGFLHYRLSNLTEIDLMALFQSFQTLEFKFEAGADLLEWFTQTGNHQRAEQVIQVLKAGNLKPEQLERFGLLLLKYYTAAKKYEDLKNLLAANPALEDSSYMDFFKAILLTHESKNTEASVLFNKVKEQLILDPQAVSEMTKYYQQVKQPETAYRLVEQALQLNPYSTVLLKTYILQATLYGIPSFADSGLEQLQSLSTKKDYEAFLPELDEAKKAFAESIKAY